MKTRWLVPVFVLAWLALAASFPARAASPEPPASFLQDEAGGPRDEPNSKTPADEADLMTPPPASGANQVEPPAEEAPAPLAADQPRFSNWIHEGMIGIYGGGSHAGPGGHYTLLYRPHLFYSVGLHAGLARTQYENEDLVRKASILHMQAAVEGRVYMIQDILTFWLSANLGGGFFTETQSDSDALNADYGFLWGFGLGIDLSAGEHFSWGLAFRYYRLVPRGEKDQDISDYYGRGGINIHVSYHY